MGRREPCRRRILGRRFELCRVGPESGSGHGGSRAAIVDKRTKRSQPRLVAPPARDRGAIDRLPGLPLAGGLYGAWIRFGAQTRIMPREPGGGDNPPDYGFRRVGQVLIVD